MKISRADKKARQSEENKKKSRDSILMMSAPHKTTYTQAERHPKINNKRNKHSGSENPPNMPSDLNITHMISSYRATLNFIPSHQKMNQLLVICCIWPWNFSWLFSRSCVSRGSIATRQPWWSVCFSKHRLSLEFQFDREANIFSYQRSGDFLNRITW